MASKTDYQLASLAAGFTIGFGFLTVWEAIKQTRSNRNPARSAYIYMVWGEIVSNVAITIMVWLMLDGILKPEYVQRPLICCCCDEPNNVIASQPFSSSSSSGYSKSSS